MENEEKLKVFLDQVLQRPMPNNPMARIRVLAKELAEGAAAGLWEPYISAVPSSIERNKFELISPEISQYVAQRWANDYPNLVLLQSNGYLGDRFQLTRSAYNLIEEVEPSTIFISYRRKDSSALALLVLARLKMVGLDAHLDMAIQPGDNWHAHLKEQIQKRDYFILLLGNETLTSEVVCKEILWALEAGATIIPIWHNGFQYKGQPNLDPRIDEVLRNTHTIRVTDESALGYETALIELLNFFGVTP